MPLDLSAEKTFVDGEYPTRYLHIPGTSDELIGVFSGFEPTGQPRYNYVRSLEGARPHRVYILDDLGARGCYYLGENRDFLVERSVFGLIEHLRTSLDIDRGGVTLAGSSKGGSAALYLAVKYGYGRVLVAGPQTLIGTYLTGERQARSVLRLIAGGDSQGCIEWLDSVVVDAIRKSPYRPKIEILTSDGDHQRPLHVTPIVELLHSLRYDVEVIEGSYRPHGNVGLEFKELLRARYG